VAAPRVLADVAHRGVDARQRLPDGGEQLRAGLGQLDGARVAQEQRHADVVLQRLDLAADGRLGERHLLGRQAEVEVARHRLEGAQVAGLDGARAQVGLGVQHGGH
jgi:hypothetical protein